MQRKTYQELVLINIKNQVTSDDAALQSMANTEKTYASNRAQALGALVAGSFCILIFLLAIVLGLTGVFTPMGAGALAFAGGFFGGMAVGTLVGSMFYVIKMWTSTSWGISE